MSVDYYVDGIMSLNQYNDKKIKPKMMCENVSR